ncbi:MAG: hypothetical protein V3R15_02425, partial [Qipengyuania citrea]
MDSTAPSAEPPRDSAALAAFAALALLPLVLLAVVGGWSASGVAPTDPAPAAADGPLPDLPASPEDTVVGTELAAGDAQARNAAVAFAAIGPGAPLPFGFAGN